RYGDVRSAEADGFRRFLPGVRQPVYHYTSWRSALAAQFRFDAVRPTSLLYKEGPRGTLVLVGAMYTAPARASFDELDRRVPLAVARWRGGAVARARELVPAAARSVGAVARDARRETRVRTQVPDSDGSGVPRRGRKVRPPA